MKFLFFLLFARPIWGLIAMNVASNRKMKGGFWWGFFLGIIGIIVVTMRPNDKPPSSGYAVAKKINNSETIRNLKKYKELLDEGVLAQEEFDRIKTDLLWNAESDDIETETEIDRMVVRKAEKPIPTNESNMVICPKCGEKQFAQNVCWKCGTPFMYAQIQGLPQTRIDSMFACESPYHFLTSGGGFQTVLLYYYPIRRLGKIPRQIYLREGSGRGEYFVYCQGR